MTILIATIKSWNIERARLFKRNNTQWDVHLITNKSEFEEPNVKLFDPRYIFLPHWSWKIPKKIYNRWECVVFHMTDLPFGRGGSPLQNLLSKGIYKTKISALRVAEGIDDGPIYLKRDLDLLKGSAEEIYREASRIVFDEMIPYIVEKHPDPVPQEGKVVCFSRRTPEQSEINPNMDLKQLYDHIRMLDAEGYPRSFMNFGQFRMEFSNAKMEGNGEILATTRICVKEGLND